MNNFLIMGVIGGVAVLALMLTVYTLLIHQRIPEVLALKRDLNNLQLSHNDLFERFERYQRRANTRAIREKNEPQVEEGTQLEGRTPASRLLAFKKARRGKAS